MTVVLAIMIILLLIRSFHLSQLQYQHDLISRIAELRRKLIYFISKDTLDVNSELFRFSYQTVELLLRVHYFRLLVLLPSPMNLLIIGKLGDEEQKRIKKVISELKIVCSTSKGKEFLSFFKRFIHIVSRAFVRNRVFLMICLLAVFGFFQARNAFSSLKKISANTKQISNLVSQHA